MPQHKLFRFLLLAALGLIAGFLALAIAVPLEPQVAAPLIALFSPGLKLAEFVTPESGKSFALPSPRTPLSTTRFSRLLHTLRIAAAPNSSVLRQLAGDGWNSGGGRNERPDK